MTWLMKILKICLENASDKILLGKAFSIAKNPKYGYERGLASMAHKCFNKKSTLL